MTFDVHSLLNEIEAGLPDPLPQRLGVAVSGGSDSTALLRALLDLSQKHGFVLAAATVDHGLRENSASEAKNVADLAKSWGIPHKTLHWTGWDRAGNLQDAARRARYGLLLQWAKDHRLDAIALGHTADDQAETVLMRLGRAAGVSGLAGMSRRRRQDGVDLVRPMLSVTRARLRAYLSDQGIDWIEDPSNQDDRFDRIKVRRALKDLKEIGITVESLSHVADNLTQARDALARYAHQSAKNVVHVATGDLCIRREEFSDLPNEIRRRIVVTAVQWLGGSEYPPRQNAVDQAIRSISDGTRRTLGGCMVIPDAQDSWICREHKAVAEKTVALGEVWDGRWILRGPESKGVTVRALGDDGLKKLEDWRAMGKPREVLLSTPSAWKEGQLLAAPLAGMANLWYAETPINRPDYYASILSH